MATSLNPQPLPAAEQRFFKLCDDLPKEAMAYVGTRLIERLRWTREVDLEDLKEFITDWLSEWRGDR